MIIIMKSDKNKIILLNSERTKILKIRTRGGIKIELKYTYPEPVAFLQQWQHIQE